MVGGQTIGNQAAAIVVYVRHVAVVVFVVGVVSNAHGGRIPFRLSQQRIGGLVAHVVVIC